MLLSKLTLSPVYRNIIETLGTRIALMSLGVLYSILVARALGPEGRGILAVAVSITLIGTQLSHLGLSTAYVYSIAKDRSLLPALLGNGLVTSGAVGVIVGIVSATLLFVSPDLFPVRGILLLVALLWIPFSVARLLMENLMVGLEDIRGYNTNEIFVQLSTAVAIGAIILLDATRVETIFIAQFAMLLLGLILCFYRIGFSKVAKATISRSQFLRDIRYGVKAYSAGLADTLFNQVDFIMLAGQVSAEQIGLFSIAVSIRTMIYTYPATVAMIIYPKLCESHDYRDQWNITNNSIKTTATALLAICVAIIVIGKQFIVLLFSESFSASYLPLILMLPGLFFLSLDNIYRKILNAHKDKGFRTEIVYIWIVLLVVKLAGNYLLISDYGVKAVIIVSNICYFISFAYIGLMTYKEHRGQSAPGNTP